MLGFVPLHLPATSSNKSMCVFLLAAEEEISFPPTYRYERGSRDTYVWQKQKATGVWLSFNLNNITDRLTPNHFWQILTHFIFSFCELSWLSCCVVFYFSVCPRWGLMFRPGVTGSCGSRTQKHTLSATPTVRPSVKLFNKHFFLFSLTEVSWV